MSRWKLTMRIGLAVGAVVTVSATTIVGKEARPPKWSRDVLDAFFDDARDELEGSRPDYERTTERERSVEANAAATGAAADFGWSKLIGADVLETEVKRVSQSVAGTVSSPSAFKGGGSKGARRDFSELAVLFAVTAQYDGEARWKDAAAGLRDVFSRAAAKAKVGSDASYRDAVSRQQDLAELVRGGRPQLPKADAQIVDWSQVASRPPLMQRLELAHQERLTKWLADERTFRRNVSDVAHEAQIVALLAEIVHRESFEYWDDETFTGHADELRNAANDVSAAATANDFEQARDAIGRATKACADCHDGYRG